MASIEEKVLSLKIKHDQFRKGIDQSISALNKLSSSLRLDKAADGLTRLADKVSVFNFNPIRAGLDAIKPKFLDMASIAEIALGNIAAKAAIVGSKLISSFVFKPISDGFAEYENKLNSVQTILANTQHKGENIKSVTAALNNLNEYADKTIYNFGEMTRNIGTFTAAGVGLENSKNAIKGISNLAALSGSNAQQASTAMYQLSQAISSGTVKLMDWNSVQNAGMGGEVFQEALKRTARVHGVAVDQMIAEQGSFRDSLQKGWLTSEILLDTLTQLTGDLSKEQLMAQGYTSQQADEMIRLAQTASDAATKIKTFSQLMDTTAEALGSGWAETWEIVFGDFEESRELWTKVGDVVGDYVNNVSNARNATLRAWKEMGGRRDLVEGLGNIFTALGRPLKVVSELLREVFGGPSAKSLHTFTAGFKNLTGRLVISDVKLAKLKDTLRLTTVPLKLLVSIVKMVSKVLVGTLGVALNVVYNLLRIVSSGVLTLGSALGRRLQALYDWIAGLKLFAGTGEKVAGAARKFVDWMDALPDKVDAYTAAAYAATKAKLDVYYERLSQRIATVRTAFERRVNPVLTTYMDVLRFRYETLMATIRDRTRPTIERLQRFQNQVQAIWDELGQSAQHVSREFSVAMRDLAIKTQPYLDKLKTAVRNLAQVIGDELARLWSMTKPPLTKFVGGVKAYAAETYAAISKFVGDLASSGLNKVSSLLTFDSGGVLASISGFLSKLQSIEGVKSVLADIATFLTKDLPGMIGTGATKAVDSIVNGISSLLDTIANLRFDPTPLVDFIETVFVDFPSKVVAGFQNLGGAIASARDILTKFLAKLTGDSKIAERIVDLFTVKIPRAFLAAYEIVEQTVLGILRGLNILFDGLKSYVSEGAKSLQGFDLGTLFAGLTSVGIFGIWLQIRKGFNGINEILENFGGSLEAFTGVLESVSSRINASTNAVNARALRDVAIGIGVMAAAIWLLSGIPAKELAIATGALTASMISIMGIMKLMSSITADPKIVLVGIALAALAASVALVAVAAQKLSALSWDEILKGVIAVAALSAAMVAAGYVMSLNKSGIIQGAFAMILFAGSIWLLGAAVQKLGSLDTGVLLKGTVAVAAILAIMGAYATLTDGKADLANALSLLLIAGALYRIGLIIQQFAEMPWEAWRDGIIKMGITLGGIVYALKAIPPDAVQKALLLIAVSLALRFALVNLSLFAAFSWDAFFAGASRMAATMAIIVLGLNAIQGTVQGASALVVVSSALILMGAALHIFASMDPYAAAAGLGILAAGLILVVTAGYAATAAAPGLLAIAAVFAAIAVGAVAVGLALAAMALAITALAAGGAAAVAVILSAITGIIYMIPLFATKVGEGIAAILQQVAQMGPQLTGALTTILESLFNSLVNAMPEFGALIMSILDLILDILVKYVPKLVDAGGKILMGVLRGIANNIGGIVDQAVRVVTNFIDGIARNIGRVIQSGVNLIISFMEGIASAIRNNRTRFQNAAIDIGSAIMEGLAAGIGDGVAWVRDKITGAVDSVISSAKALLGINSPSKVFMRFGAWVSEGLGIGIERGGRFAVSAIEVVGDDIKDTMSLAIKETTNMFDREFTQPSIRPTIDLTEVRAGLQEIGSNTVNMPLGLSGFRTSAETIDPTNLANKSQNGSGVGAPVYNYTQNNYSPRPLSRIDLYRYTDRQLQQLPRG